MRLGTLARKRVIMDLSYALAPFLAWLVAGLIKFTINSIKAREFAFSLIGYGGFPSNHSEQWGGTYPSSVGPHATGGGFS